MIDNKIGVTVKAFGVLNKEILIGVSVLPNKMLLILLDLLSSMTDLTKSVTCRKFLD